MRQQLYNTSQWHWVADRLGEGYAMPEMSQLLGMHPNNIRNHLVRVGRRIPLESRVALADRKKEFYALALDESGVSSTKIPVVGTGPDGETVRFDSLKEAADWLGVQSSQISNAMKYNFRCHGYTWRKETE